MISASDDFAAACSQPNTQSCRDLVCDIVGKLLEDVRSGKPGTVGELTTEYERDPDGTVLKRRYVLDVSIDA